MTAFAPTSAPAARTGTAVVTARTRGRAADLAAVVLPTVVFLVHALRYRQWLVDDALISLAYARTLSEGGGLAQSVGDDPVEGVSNPTWTVLLAGLRLLGLSDHGHAPFGVADTVWVVRGLAVLCFVATLLCLRRAAAALLPAGSGSALATGVAGALLACSPPYVVWAVSGLENPLYGLLVAALAAQLATADAGGTLLTTRTAVTSAALALLLAATRPDGAVFFAAYPVVVALRVRRPRPEALRCAAVYTAVFGVVALVLLSARRLTFGLWVPNTAVAKSQTLDLAALPSRLGDLLTAAGPWVVVSAAVAVVLAVLLPRLLAGPSTTRWAPLVVPFLLACLAFLLLNRDWMAEYRFATPAAVLGAGLVGVAWSRCLGLSPRLRWRWSVGTLVALLLVGDAVAMTARVEAFAAAPTVPGCWVADRYGRATDAYADALGITSGTYLVPDIGGVLLTSRLRVVDLAGLTDPTIARLRSARDWKGLRDHVIDDVRPTFVHLHRPWDPGLARDKRFRRDYVALVPGADYVRRDVADPEAVRRLVPLARTWARQASDDRANRPLAGCAPLVP